MKVSFNLSDIINLEYLFYQDKEESLSFLQTRDRHIFLSCKEENTIATTGNLTKDSSAESRQKLLQHWIIARLKEELITPEQRSPGSLFTDALRIGKIGAMAKGALGGIVTGIAFFTYTGATPVNVFQFLFLFIGSQLVLLGILLASLILRKFAPHVHLPDFYTVLFERAFTSFAHWLQQKSNKMASAKTRNAAYHALSMVKVHNGRYGRLLYWALFSLTQIFALAFNIALLLFLLLKIAATDLAFGWQSTIQFSDSGIHTLTNILALPWSWLIGAASPSVETIAGSRIILKDGIAALSTTDLTGWWPFLVMCLFMYGVMARLFFFVFGLWMERRAECDLAFDTPQIEALLRRMETPLVSTQGTTEKAENRKEQPQKKRDIKSATEIEEGVSQPLEKEKQSIAIIDTPQSVGQGAILSKRIVLIGIDIYEALPVENLEIELEKPLASLGFESVVVVPIQADYDKDQQLLQHLNKDWQEAEGIMIIVEGWMVPLVGFLSYLGDIRKSVAKDMIVSIGLVGRPTESVFTAVTSRDFAIWRQKVEGLADPYFHLFPLIGMEEKR